LGVLLAKKYDGEIISADSRQTYKGLNVGSGKITKKEMGGIPHYCLDIANPRKVFTADNFVKCARKAIYDILSRGKIPIIVGGTGFYIDATLGKIKLANVPPNPQLRKKLEKKSVEELFIIFKKLNPRHAATIDSHNPRRLIRAIEIAQHKPQADVFTAGFEPVAGMVRAKRASTGRNLEPRSLGAARKAKTHPLAATLWLGIKRSPKELKKRIAIRLKKRLPGIIIETKKLHRGGVSWKRMYEFGLEYRYVPLFIRGIMTKNEMTKKLETEIRHYAKRQMTWWRRNKEINWVSSGSAVKKMVKKFL